MSVLGAHPVDGAEALRQVRVSADVQSMTSLQVSSSTLVFDVQRDGRTATASIDYVAAARTRRDGEVVLTVELAGGIQGPGGAADVATIVSVGDGPGESVMSVATTATAARWTGAGARAGRLTFSLRADTEGIYVVPLNLVLSAP